MTYRELISKPIDGLYLVIGTNTHVLINGAKIVHSPHGMTIDDDADVEACD